MLSLAKTPFLQAFAALVLMCSLCACDSIATFSTDGTERFVGGIFGARSPETCPAGVDCSFLRRGFPSTTSLELNIDTGSLYSQPGTISTRGEMCGVTFDNTELRPIAALAHDVLSLFEFPGRGRGRNYMMVATPQSGPAAGRDAMIILSLMRGGLIEVRIIAGSGEQNCDPNECAAVAAGECDYFGVFELRHEDI